MDALVAHIWLQSFLHEFCVLHKINNQSIFKVSKESMNTWRHSKNFFIYGNP